MRRGLADGEDAMVSARGIGWMMAGGFSLAAWTAVLYGLWLLLG